MADSSYAILALLPIVAVFLYSQIYNWRYKKFSHIPQYLPLSLPLGHLKCIAKAYKQLGDSRRHSNYVFTNLWKEAGCPQMMLVDLRPVNYPMTVVTSHEVAEQISKATKMYPYSVIKSPTLLSTYRRLIGARSILTEEGDSWKSLRRRFNAGFAPQHLLTLLPAIIEKSTTFMSILDTLAETGEECEMDSLCTNLTFDIIGDIVINVDFHAQGDQSSGHEIVHHFRELLKTFSDTGRMWLWLNLPTRLRRLYHSIQADAAIKRCIKEKFGEIKDAQSSNKRSSKDRSVLALALKDVDVLTSDNLQSCADQVKTFLFAGHDTTSILLQWLFYALSIHPKCLDAIRAEHDAVFGDRDPREVFLSKPDETLAALSYTSACIKEALRLWPPAGSARLSPPGKGFKVRLEDGKEVLVDDTILYLNHHIIQRDPKVYGETADDFVPDRWLGDTDTTAVRKDEDGSQAGASKIPISAWRPFERGPRNCIGQELANLEARVILACVIRKYDFIKVGAGELELDEKGRPIFDDKGRYKTKSELFTSMVVTSRPFDKCRMRIKMHQAAP